MNSQQFNDMKSRARTRQDEILDSKGEDYTASNEDRLFNFKFIGTVLDMDPKKVCMVYYLKHILALCNRVKGGQESEPVTGRLDDATNYPLLLEGLFEDEANEGVDDPNPCTEPECSCREELPEEGVDDPKIEWCSPTCNGFIRGQYDCDCEDSPEQVRDRDMTHQVGCDFYDPNKETLHGKRCSCVRDEVNGRVDDPKPKPDWMDGLYGEFIKEQE